MSNDKPQAGRIALVTGASRGIGAAVSLALARAGAHVVAAARNVAGLEELDDAIRRIGGTSTLVPFDLKDYPAIDRLGASLFERFGRLDCLVGNAGVLGPISPLGHVDPKAFEEALQVNVTANWRLIRSMDPLLKRSPAGRAVFLTSGASWKATAYWGPYAVSKSALDTLVRTYAAETEAISPVRVNLYTPGPLRTRMRALAMPGEDPMSLDPPDAVAADIAALLDPAMNETGKVFGRAMQAMRFRAPE